MVTYKKVKRTCNKIIQTSGGEYQPFNDLNNLKVQNSYYAQTELLRTKNGTPNRPSLLMLSDFRFNIPAAARVHNIKVIYEQRKIGLKGPDSTPGIGKPIINLLNTHGIKVTSQMGQAPTNETKTEELNFTTSADGTKKGIGINASIVNDSQFAVQMRYPANDNMNEGYFRIYNIVVEVTYVVPAFSLSLGKAKGVYNGDEYEITAKISNLEPTTFIPLVTINVPIGFTLENFGKSADASFEQRSARVLVWYPKLYGVQSDTLTLHFSTNVTYTGSNTSYTGTFDISEALNSTYKALNVTVLKPLPTVEEIEEETGEPIIPPDEMDPDEDNPIFHYKQGEYFRLMFHLTPEEIENTGITYGTRPTKRWAISVFTNPDFEITDFSSVTPRARTSINNEQLNANGDCTVRFYQNLICDNTLILWAGVAGSSDILRIVNYEIYPKDLTPSVSIMEVKGEELDRLGDGYNYIVQSNMKRVGSEPYPKDWGPNFRLGVFNTGIKENITVHTYTDEDGEEQEIVVDKTDYDNLDIDTIMDNANWSGMRADTSYQSITVEFTYRKEYPVYILVVGDYDERNSDSYVKFDEPCIIEANRYSGRESNGIYPVPILATLGNETSGEETIPALRTASDLIYYKFPLPEDYGTNENYAVMGIEVTGNVEKADEMVIFAKLISPTGESHSRSITISDYEIHSNNDNKFSIGGFGDLWGFSTLDIVQLEDWEVELSVANTINPTAGTINFNNIEITFYVVDVEETVVKTYVNGEDLSYYGIFLNDLKVPEGLNTDLNWVTINGTDTNDALKQAIREKKLELEFDIGESCSVLSNTQALRRLVALLQNERDEYNKPIPNIIQFSHYPDVYWKYILEDTFNNKLEINSYKVKVKLTIPEGTAFSQKEHVSNTYGRVDGLTHVNPTILIRPLSNAMIITEKLSGQTFNFATPEYEDKVIEIDCKNRKVLLKEETNAETSLDISKYVDLNSDWFRLLGEYAFDTTNCIISSIKYRERW